MNNEPLGRQLPRAKPVMLTFYDRLKDVPFTTTFYVREDESRENVEELIDAIRAVSLCVLGKYKIGYQEYVVPDYREQLENIASHALGWQKWVVKLRTERGATRSFSIPGPDPSLDMNAKLGGGIGKKGRKPAPSLPQWQRIIELVKRLCVDKTGEELRDWVELDYRIENWPPKRARRR